MTDEELTQLAERIRKPPEFGALSDLRLDAMAASSAILSLMKERDRWKAVAEQFAEPFWCGSDCPCHNPAEEPVAGILDAFPECWRSKVEARATLAETRLEKAVSGLEPFAKLAGRFTESVVVKARGSAMDHDLYLLPQNFDDAASILSEITEAKGE